MRLDRRADWTATAASPVGLGFRGRLDPTHSDEFWPYDALGPRIWTHRDNERAPERPLVFVLQTTEDEMEQRRPQAWMARAVVHRRPGELREVRVRGPSKARVPLFFGLPIVFEQGGHLLELVVDDEGTSRPVSDGLMIRS
jgi:hypothetical protein